MLFGYALRREATVRQNVVVADATVRDRGRTRAA
jgi:hypothetical protein